MIAEAEVSGSVVLALDLAILLPHKFQQKVLRLNANLLPPPSGFRFDSTHLPHVSLVQQFVALDRLDHFIRQTTTLLHNVRPIELRPNGPRSGRTTATLIIERTTALAELHSHLMDQLLQFAVESGNTSAFLSDQEQPRSSDVRWVTTFRNEAAYDLFDPHVTLGVGSVPPRLPQTNVLATRLAVCHLGRFCTCRRVFAEWSLTP